MDVAAPHLRQINPTGKIALSPSGKSALRFTHPVPEEGALAIVTERWDRIAVDAKASCARLRLQGEINSVSDHNKRWRAVLERTAKSCGPDASEVGVKSFGRRKSPTGP